MVLSLKNGMVQLMPNERLDIEQVQLLLAAKADKNLLMVMSLNIKKKIMKNRCQGDYLRARKINP